MTYNEVIARLETDVENAKLRLQEAQQPSEGLTQYFYLLCRIRAKRALQKAEEDLQYLRAFLVEYQMDKDQDTGGLEVLILRNR